MAAIYIHAKKNRGYLHKLQVDAKNLRKLHFEALIKYNQDIKGNQFVKNLDDSFKFEETFDDNGLDPKVLWMKLIQKNESKISDIDKVRNTIKILETISGIISFIIILLSVYEYELYYYPIYFIEQEDIKTANPKMTYDEIQLILNDKYEGIKFRVVFTVLCFMLIILNLLSNIKWYYINYETQKISDRKFLI